MNSPAAPSSFCREPKDVLVPIRLQVAFEDVIGLLEKKLNFEPYFLMITIFYGLRVAHVLCKY